MIYYEDENKTEWILFIVRFLTALPLQLWDKESYNTLLMSVSL